MKGKGYITFMVAAALSMGRSLPWLRNQAVGNRAVRSWEP